MKQAIFFIGVIILLIFLYKSDFVRNFIAKVLLPNAFKEYQYLSENSVKSENYEIRKIIDGDIDYFSGGIFFIKESNSFLIKTNTKNPNEYTLWKINDKGEVIDSLTTSYPHLFTSGMFFNETHFVDWVNTGNKTKREYTNIINMDEMSEVEFEAYLDSAEVIDFYTEFKDRGRCFLKTEEGWTVLETKKRFKEFETDYEKDYYEIKLKGYSKKNSDKLIVLEDIIKPFQQWTDEDNLIFIQKFIEESSQSRPLFDLNNHGRSGWNGIGFFQVNYNSENLNFKAYTFRNGSFSNEYQPDISIYSPPNNLNLLFIELAKKRNRRQQTETGLYVLRRKSK